MTRRPFRILSTPLHSVQCQHRRPLAATALEALEGRTLFSTFTVTTGDDAGAGSLREAIALADDNPGADTVDFAPGVTTVTLTTAQLNPTTEMKIAGPTGGTVTVTRSAAPGTPVFRIFRTGNGAIVELANLTITNGREVVGGGISAGGPLTVTSCTLTGNSAVLDGGAIIAGRMSLSNSTISGNSAGRDGGGLYHVHGPTTVTSTTISGNSAGHHGGGIFLNSLQLNLFSSDVSSNTANRGGGVYVNDGTGRLLVVLSTLSSNSARSEGGAILLVGGFVDVSATTLSGNSAGSNGGGIAVFEFGSARFTSDTLSGNSVGFNGGAMYNNGGTGTFTACTVSGNSARFGGGVATARSLEATSSTFSGNTASEGGGIFAIFGPATLNDTIVANSTGGDLAVNPGLGSFSGTGNLIEDDSGGAGLGRISGDPNLALLADNGGYTFTHALLPGSIAIDAGDDAVAAGLLDQRGLPRFVGTVDIGSIEEQSRTPAQQAADLQARVRAFQAAGVLNKGQANSLIVKLNLKGNNGDAGKARSFLNEVDAFLRAGILTQAQADSLSGPGSVLLLTVTHP
jgi:predicted outer membrane repeat protein